MKPVAAAEFPPAQEQALRLARRIEWVTIAYLISSVVLLYLVMGSSQAMRTSALDDLVSLVPPIAFLVTTRIVRAPASPDFPYGRHRAVSIGYLTASLALAGMGLFLLFEAAMTLIRAERPTIGGFDLFGGVIWAGWPMLAALAYAAVPSFFLGRVKLGLARKLHDKTLYADAEMNRADWMAVSAAAVGVLGIGFGLWWADGAAAALIALDILHDGYRNVRAALTDLTDRIPKKTTEPEEPDILPEALERHLAEADWVARVAVRMREQGHVYFGEAFVVPHTEEGLTQNIAALVERAKRFHWRVHELTVMPVRPKDFDEAAPEGIEGEQKGEGRERPG